MKKAILFCLAFLGLGVLLTLSIVWLYLPSSWVKQYLALLGLGGALALAMLQAVTPSLLCNLALLPYGSPNWLSLWRIPVIWLGQIIFFSANGRLSWLICGLLLVVEGLITDRLDGRGAKSLLRRLRFLSSNDNGRDGEKVYLWALYRVARKNTLGEEIQCDERVILDEWIWRLTCVYTKLPMFRVEKDEVNPGLLRLVVTGIGDWLDPLVDKFNYLPVFAYLAWRDLACWWMAALMILVDLCGTLIREPFISHPFLRRLTPYVREMKASALGKTKVIWQILTLLAVIPAGAGWLSPTERQVSWWVVSSLLSLAVLTGLLSVLSRLAVIDLLWRIPGLRKHYQRLSQTYEH